MQQFKAVYYADYQEHHPGARSMTIAFGESDQSLYEATRHMSSHQLRGIIGHETYGELLKHAKEQRVAVNTLCLERAREVLERQDRADGTHHLAVDPLQVTFKGGADEPTHGWYSYLEGYSPRFVRHIVEEFAPLATCVYDPFGGVGTTPLSVAEMGISAVYSELNPFLRDLADAKTAARLASVEERAHARQTIVEVAESLELLVARCERDEQLDAAYRAAFGSSEFFDARTYDSVLRCRTLADGLVASDALAAQLFVVAAANSLIPASRLQRAGDIRYKSERETQRKPELTAAIRQNLLRIAEDLTRLKPLAEAPVLLCADAKDLGLLQTRPIDLVVTSPPYLNGTNYFRNTKVELWFTRHLRDSSDLAGLRRLAVTAGINDVTKEKGLDYESDAVEALVSTLAATAYDKRIPRMVAQYFTDMATVFRGLSCHLADGATVAVDIGDSIYGGIHVATDALLVDVLEPLGYSLAHDITLRTRSSYNGAVLRQALLVFEYRPRLRNDSSDVATSSTEWSTAWEAFKSTLPHQSGSFAARNWGSPLHSLCSYQGKMKPSLAHHLARVFVPEGGRMLDVFAGVGTIPFEAALAGATAYGFDISPAAIPIARAKLGHPDRERCADILSELALYLTDNEPTDAEYSQAREFGFNGTLDAFFEPRTLREVLLARRYFLSFPPEDASRALVMAATLHVLHGNRPYALSRRSHPITPFAPTGEFEYKSLLASVASKVNKSLDAARSSEFRAGVIYNQDATSEWPDEVTALDAIITSPPFFDSTRFHMGNWMRLWFAGWEPEDFRSAPQQFVDERQKRSFGIYEPIFGQAVERLRPGGVFVLHLGRSKKCNMAEQLAQVAGRYMTVADVFSESVEHCESHGIRDKGTVVDHQYLVLRNGD